MCTIGSRVGRGVVGPSCCGAVVGVASSRIMVGGSEEVTVAVIVGADVVGSLVARIGVRVGKEEDDALGSPVGSDNVDGARLGDEEEDDDSVGAKDGNEEDDVRSDGEELLIIVGDDGDIDAFVNNNDVGKGELDEPSPAPVDSSELGTNDKLGAVDGNNDPPPPEDEKVGDGDEEVVVVPFKPSIMMIDGEKLTVGAAVGT